MNEKTQLDLTGKFQCPMRECNKEYKTNGWLNRHVKECHPTYQGTMAKDSEGREERNERDVEDNKDRSDQYPYPNCNKTLPTWKGIVHHCYRIHKWSAVTKQPVRPKTASATRSDS